MEKDSTKQDHCVLWFGIVVYKYSDWHSSTSLLGGNWRMIHIHKHQVKSWTSWTLYGDLHTSMKMDQLWKDRRGSNGESLSAVIGNLNMERCKEQAVTSSPNIHRCGLLNAIPFALGQDFKYNIRPTILGSHYAIVP